MTVPEAPLDKDHGAVLALDQIGPARQRPGRQAETEPRPVQGASHPHLWQGVAPADRRHHARPGGSINDVGHDRQSVSAMAVREHTVRLVWVPIAVTRTHHTRQTSVWLLVRIRFGNPSTAHALHARVTDQEIPDEFAKRSA